LIAAVGPWKSTKTYALLDLAISVATGQPAFGALAIPEPGPVVYVLEESGRAALWRRLDQLCRGRAVPPEHLRELHVSTNARVKLDDPEWQARLIETAQRIGPRLIVFDPLARMKAATRNENEQTAVAAVIDFWRQLRDETGAAVALVHHQGHHGPQMRGSSDLESVWETRLTWARDEATIRLTADHREAETSPAIEYRLAFDEETRTMRLALVEDEVVTAVREYLAQHPGTPANEIVRVIGAKRTRVLDAVRMIRPTGSGSPEPPGTTTLAETGSGVEVSNPLKGVGTTPTEPVGSTGSDTPEPSVEDDRPRIGDDGYLDLVFAAFEAGHVTEGEWRQADRAHRYVLLAGNEVAP